MENFGKFMAILISMIINPIIRGFVFISLWAWFIVPTFNVSPLRLIEAIGIMFIVGYVFYVHKDEDKDEDLTTRVLTATIINILFGAIILGLGWIWQLFM